MKSGASEITDSMRQKVWRTTLVALFLLANCSSVPLYAQFTTLYSFAGGTDGANGFNPDLQASASPLCSGSDGDLYGVADGVTTEPDGVTHYGAIYKIDSSGNFSTIRQADASSAIYFGSPLILGSDGYFYGTSTFGGYFGVGQAFRMDSTANFTTVYSFINNSTPIVWPNRSLVQGTDGNYYGITGGAEPSYNNGGTIFQLTPSGQFTTLYTFPTGSPIGPITPNSALVEGTDGALYGTTAPEDDFVQNGGTIYRITTTGQFSTLYTFGFDQAGPTGVVLGSDGNFYGICPNGAQDITIFRMTPQGQLSTLCAITTVRNTAASDLLLAASDGNLYGTTSNPSFLFKVTLQGVLTELYAFQSGLANPSPLVEASDGKLYGTTAEDGTYGFGTVFRYDAGIAPPFTFDFVGDGHNDLVWANRSTGQVSVWVARANGQVVTKQLGPTMGAVAPASGWSLSTVGDIDGNGHPDLIWHNSKTGQLSVWRMDGTIVKQEGPVIATVPDLNANVISCADFNGDGHNDLLWYDSSTGSLAIWLMKGTSILQEWLTIGAVAPSTGWRPVGTADFDAHGQPDILWENSLTGEHSIWYLNGTKLKGYSPVFGTLAPSTGWHVRSIADYDGDGHPDLMWENSITGEISYWLLDGAGGITLKSDGRIYPTVAPSSGWSIVGGK